MAAGTGAGAGGAGGAGGAEATGGEARAVARAVAVTVAEKVAAVRAVETVVVARAAAAMAAAAMAEEATAVAATVVAATVVVGWAGVEMEGAAGACRGRPRLTRGTRCWWRPRCQCRRGAALDPQCSLPRPARRLPRSGRSRGNPPRSLQSGPFQQER